MAEKNTPKIVNEKIVYDGGIKVIIAEVDFGDGVVHTLEYRKLPDTVVIVPVDSKNNVYLCKEWRPAHKKYILQVPAGKCYGKNEKEKIEQVHNELREEIGMDAKKIEKLYSGPLVAGIKSEINIYLAQDLFESKKDPDPDEKIEVVKIPFKDALKIFKKGEETLVYSYLGILLAKEKLGL